MAKLRLYHIDMKYVRVLAKVDEQLFRREVHNRE